MLAIKLLGLLVVCVLITLAIQFAILLYGPDPLPADVPPGWTSPSGPLPRQPPDPVFDERP